MILTLCPACAAPLPDTSAKQCSRCKTRYCGPACQKQHWEEGGHDKLCKKIKKAGGAEQYNANTKYAESVVVAAKACAEDTKGQTCYICLEAVHPSTGEGLVRGCGCQGNQGFLHVSCLVRRDEILMDEAKDRVFATWDFEATISNMKDAEKIAKGMLSCKLCKKRYDAKILRALGWGCWKRCASKSEQRWSAGSDEHTQITGALTNLGGCLSESGHQAEAAEVDRALQLAFPSDWLMNMNSLINSHRSK